MDEHIQIVVGYVTRLFVERWPEIVAVAVLITGWRWLMGYKLRDRIAVLEGRSQEQPQPVQNVNVNVGEAVKAAATANPDRPVPPGVVAQEDLENASVNIGTVNGPMTIRLWDKNATTADVIRWLHKNKLLAPLEIKDD